MKPTTYQALVVCLASLAIGVTSCTVPGNLASPDGRAVDVTADAQERSDAASLLARLKEVVPESWEVVLYWQSPGESESGAWRFAFLGEEWRDWLPGPNDRRIEVRAREEVAYWVTMPRGQEATVMKEFFERLRFSLTLGERREADDIRQRLAELNSRIQGLEAVLQPSFYSRDPDGYVRHGVPPDDAGRRALREYDRLWTIKRWFPQWSEGSLSVGFRSLVWLRELPEESRNEYRRIKQAVLGTLKPIPDWELIPANEY